MRGIQIGLVLVWTPKLTCFFVRGSKLTLFLCAGRKILVLVWAWKYWLVLFMVIRTDLTSEWGIEFDLISVEGWKWFGSCAGGRNWLATCMLAEIHLFLVWAWKLACSLIWWPIMTWFQSGRSNLTWFQCRDKNDLVVVWVVDIDLVLEPGAKITCF